MPERTYRLASGDLISGEYATVGDTDYFDDGDACDVIAEEWKLVRYRTLRLGAPELCSVCGGEGEVERPVDLDKDDVTRGPVISESCAHCDGDGNEPRDDNPPWVYPPDPFGVRQKEIEPKVCPACHGDGGGGGHGGDCGTCHGTGTVRRASSSSTPTVTIGSQIKCDGCGKVTEKVTVWKNDAFCDGCLNGMNANSLCPNCHGAGGYWTEWSDAADRDPALKALVIEYADPPDGTVYIKCPTCRGE